MKKSVLVIDDDQKLIQLLTEYLGGHGYQVFGAGGGEIGLKLLQKQKPDLVILDVMLPDKNGFEVCKEIRSGSTVPIIMLTARGELTDRVVGLELGADDYLPKPFEPRELVARMASLLRRSGENAGKTRHVYGDLVIDTQTRVVTVSGKNAELSTLEFDVLLLFASHPTRVFDRDQIMNHLKGRDWGAYERSIDVLVSRLRQKLGDDPKDPKFLKTIRGTGYKFIGAV